MDREALLEAIADEMEKVNEQSRGYNVVVAGNILRVIEAAGGYAPEGSAGRENIEAARKHFEAIVDLILDSRLDAENVRALIRIEASKGLRVTE